MRQSIYFLGSLLVAVTFFFSACSNVKFETPVPQGEKSLSVFPEKLQGFYQDKDGTSLSIYENRFMYDAIESGKEEYLSDEMVLKEKGEYYYLNILSEENYWDVLQIESRKGQLILRRIELEEAELEGLSAITPLLNDIKGIGEDEEFVVINPDEKAFKQLEKQGLFSDPLVFSEVSEK